MEPSADGMVVAGRPLEPACVPLGHRPQGEHHDDADAERGQGRTQYSHGAGQGGTVGPALEVGHGISDQAAGATTDENSGEGQHPGAEGRRRRWRGPGCAVGPGGVHDPGGYRRGGPLYRGARLWS